MKKSYMNKLITIVFVSAVIILSVNAFASMEKKGSPSMKLGFRNSDAYKSQDWYISLPLEKQKAVQKIYDKYCKIIKHLRLQIYAKQAQLNALLFADKISQKEIKEQIDDINKLQSELYTKQVDMSIGLKNQGVPYWVYSMIIRGQGMNRSGIMNRDRKCEKIAKDKRCKIR